MWVSAYSTCKLIDAITVTGNCCSESIWVLRQVAEAARSERRGGPDLHALCGKLVEEAIQSLFASLVLGPRRIRLADHRRV